MRRYLLLTCVAIACLNGQVDAQGVERIPLKYGADRPGKRTEAAMQRWRDNRLGQFIHFGLYSLPGGFWKGKYIGGAAEWIKSEARIPNQEYQALTQEFRLPAFEAREWARIAREMGVKYSVITTKHHEGFCLWPSAYTDYSVASTPFGRDLLGEYVKAYNDAGIDVYFYYSIIDWHHPDWRSSIKNEADSLAFFRYRDFMLKQVEELMTRYPTVKGFWYDGTWDSSVVKHGEITWQIAQLMKKINPDIISGSRLRVDDRGARHFDSNKALMGDYEQGWERSLPEAMPVNDWECVMTVPENQWGYHAEWRGHVKNPLEIVEMIAAATSMNGNFVLNFGPKGDGSIREEEQQIAREVGRWMSVNGEAIYACEHAPFKPQKWGYYTRHRETGDIYMIVTNPPFSRVLKIQVPQGLVIERAVLLGEAGFHARPQRSTKNEYVIPVPDRLFTMPYVIKLVLKKGDSVGDYEAPKV
jgi:alpha-L-fucosidase